MNINQLMLRCSLLAKDRAPKDSGNLAFNSIRAFRTPKGFRLVQLGNAAPYGAIINTGRRDRPLSSRERANIGWWNNPNNGVYGAVQRYLSTNLNSDLDNETYKRVAQQSKNTAKRDKTFARSIPRGG